MTKTNGANGATTPTIENSAHGPETSEKTRPLKVLIACPSHGDCKTGFAYSLARAMSHFAMLPYDGEKMVDLVFIKGSILPQMRRQLVSQAMEMNATHMLFLDSDMKFPKDTITRLLNHNLAVVAANYPRKNIEARPTAYLDDGEYVGPVWTGDNSTGVQQVTVAGFGVMLIDMQVFDKLPLPFFQFTPQPPTFVKDSGEDVFFCKALHDALIPLHIDHDLSKEVAHIGEFEYTNSLSRDAEIVKQAMYRDLPVA